MLFRDIICLSILLAGGAAGRPNFIVILADDQGWGDVALHGNKDLATPNLDRLATQGARLGRFFVQPVCAPTRAEFLTGRFFSRTGVRGVSTGDERMNTGETTVAEILRDAGYATAAIGKWHNGSQSPYHPTDQGFERFHGFTSGHWGEYFNPLLEENGRHVRAKGYITDHLTDEAMRFIADNRGRSFFCHLAFCTPHSPMQVPDRFFAKFEGKTITQQSERAPKDPRHTLAALAMVENIDWNVGRLLARLDELGLTDNTVVIYFSDNGPNGWRWNGDMRGIKGSVDEGGVRVPCFIRWPRKIAPGTLFDTPAGAVDLLPTMTAMAGVERSGGKPLDGINLLPVLDGSRKDLPERMLIAVQGRGNNVAFSVRGPRFRLTMDGKLYDPVADPRQQHDLAAEYPEEVRKMRAFADAYLGQVSANLGPDKRPFTVGYAPVTWLPARDGIPRGGVKRSAQAPNCSFFTQWTKTDDRIEWYVQVGNAGRYEAILHYTCPEADIGSVVEISMGAASATATIRVAFDPPLRGAEQDRSPRGTVESLVKDFRELSIGMLDLPAGTGVLKLRALEIPGRSVADVRWLEIRRLESGDSP